MMWRAWYGMVNLFRLLLIVLAIIPIIELTRDASRQVSSPLLYFSMHQDNNDNDVISWTIWWTALLMHLFGGATLLLAFLVLCNVAWNLRASSWYHELDRHIASWLIIVVASILMAHMHIDMVQSHYPGGSVGYYGNIITEQYGGAYAMYWLLIGMYLLSLLLIRFSGMYYIGYIVDCFVPRTKQCSWVGDWFYYPKQWYEVITTMCSAADQWWYRLVVRMCQDHALVCVSRTGEYETLLALLHADTVQKTVHVQAKEAPVVIPKEEIANDIPKQTSEISPVCILPKTTHCVRSPKNKNEHHIAQNIKENIAILEEKLSCFDVCGKVLSVSTGPVVTLFEYQPEITTKVSKILALEDDLALALRAESIRIIAPIPGKSVVGFEIAHAHRVPVLIGDTLASFAYTEFTGGLPLVLGQDTIGNHVVVDLVRMPHLLIAGSTGAGKSVGLQVMLCGLLVAKTVRQMRLILIDPKRLEFARYSAVPHLLFPVVVDPKKVIPILRWVVEHMDERYHKMAQAGVRTMHDYNALVAPEEQLYWIVVVIDEFADLMMVAGKAIEEYIARIAQMARAAGIHLIIATQRPSVDVVTGLIKVNFPSRIAFRVTARVDSRTILDAGGADALLGKGDMLFLDGTSGAIKRVHGAYVTDAEIIGIVDQLKVQGAPVYISLPDSYENNDGAMHDGDSQLYQRIYEYVCTVPEISVSSIQRVFKIGYNRSARIVAELEKNGIVSGPDQGKMRRVFKRSS